MRFRRTEKTTIKDIARAVGVSTTTVINVLKGRRSEVSPAVATRVRGKASELGYVRNMTAASLVSQRSHAIALVLTGAYKPATPTEESDINPYYGELILRVENEARQAGFALNIYGGDENDYVNFVLERNLDAAVLLGVRKPELPRILARQGIPVLLIDSSFQDPRFMHIRTDDAMGGRLAAEHLIRRGCRNIAFAGNTKMSARAVPTMRLRGARQACEKQGLALREFDLNASFEDGVRIAGHLVDAGIDGVVAAADIIAAGLLASLTNLGKRVPEEIAIVGYDNLLTARMTRPALTTIDQGLHEKVEAIIELILSGKPGQHRLIEPRLVVRQSA